MQPAPADHTGSGCVAGGWRRLGRAQWQMMQRTALPDSDAETPSYRWGLRSPEAHTDMVVTGFFNDLKLKSFLLFSPLLIVVSRCTSLTLCTLGPVTEYLAIEMDNIHNTPSSENLNTQYSEL